MRKLLALMLALSALHAAPQRGRVEANGITIAYESFGPAGRETVLAFCCPPHDARQAGAALFTALEDRRARLKNITVPTVVVHVDEDPIVPVSAGRDVAESIPNAKLLVIPGMGTKSRPRW